MHQLTHENHFKFGYDNDWYRPRRTAQERYTVVFGKCAEWPLSFAAECQRAARLIRDATTLPIVVMLSGGGDSEVALRSFHSQGIPVRAAIMQYHDNINLHDISFAVVCCEQLGVPYSMVDLDLLDFWRDAVYDYAERTQSVSPQLCATMWLADQIDGYPVLASGECTFRLRRQDDGVHFVEEERIAAWYRHFLVPGRQREACPGFLQYTPELMLAALSHPVVGAFLSNDAPVADKLALYIDQFGIAPRVKFTGFEKVQHEDAVVRAELRRRFPAHSDTTRFSYDEIVRHLSLALDDQVRNT